jgi:ketosteroid isomerase-like protein
MSTHTAVDTGIVERATEAFHEALRTNDLETFMSYVAADVFFMPPGEPPVRGRDALRTWMAAFLAQFRTSSLTLADREVLVGNGWAVELGTFEWALQPVAGGAEVIDRGNYMQVWREQDDKTWKFAREVYNSSVPL